MEKWPGPQTLAPISEVNSAIVIADVDVYCGGGDRIRQRPILHVILKEKTADVDWEEDFASAAELWLLRNPPV